MKLKKILCQLLCTALVFTAMVNPVAVHAENEEASTNEETTIATEAVYDSENYKISDYADGMNIPEKSGYEFAGWYTGDGDVKKPLTTRTVDEGVTVYAKFVPEAVLDVRYQLTKSTYVTSDVTALRLVTTVDSTNYKKVGFYVALEGVEGTATCDSTSVYSQIDGYTSDGTTYYKPYEEFNPASRYFMCYNITDIGNTLFTKNFTITPFWITMDGTTVTGDTKVINIRNTVYKGSVYGDGITVTPGTDVAQDVAQYEAQFTVAEKVVTEGMDEGKTYTSISEITMHGYANLKLSANADAGLKANTYYYVIVDVACNGDSSAPAYFDDTATNGTPKFIIWGGGGQIKFNVQTDANGEFIVDWTKVYLNPVGLTYVDFTGITINEVVSAYPAGVTILPYETEGEADYTVSEKISNGKSYTAISDITKYGWSKLMLSATQETGLKANAYYDVVIDVACDGNSEAPVYFDDTATNGTPKFIIWGGGGQIKFTVTTNANGEFVVDWTKVWVNPENLTYVDFTGITITLKKDIDVRVALATQKITQDEDISNLSEGALVVSAAKGETEGGQFIVKCDEDIWQYEVSVSDLTSGTNTIASSAISVQTEIYAYATNLHSNGLPSGSYPDALIPVGYIVSAGENKIEANKNQGFFVDVKVPEDAAAGTYTGSIVLLCDGQEIIIPIQVEVFDFVISSVPYTKTCYLIWQDWLIYGELDSTDEKYMDYYNMMLEYNVCGYSFPHTTAEEFVSYVREFYSKVPCFGIPYDPIDNNQDNDWDKYVAYMSALAQASIEDGINYFDKAYYYFDVFYDEYTLDTARRSYVTQMADKCDALEGEIIQNLLTQGQIDSTEDELAQSILSLTHVIPVTTINDLVEHDSVTHVPVMLAVADTVSMEQYTELTPEGNEYWWYTCGTEMVYPSPDRHINGYLVSARDHFWSNYEYDIVGDLYWCVNGYCNWSETDSNGRYLPIENLYTTASHEGVTNGDGYLLYPGNPYGSSAPFASLRLTALRDGIDDNTYMGMLGDMYQQLSNGYGTNVSDAKSLVSFLNKNVISRQVSKLSSEDLLISRAALAKTIELAAKQGVLIEEISVEQNVLSFTVYTDASTAFSVYGATVNSTVAGSGIRYVGYVSLDNSGKISFIFTKNGSIETLELPVPSMGTLTNDFETSQAVNDCVIPQNLFVSAKLNTDSDYSINGNSAKFSFSKNLFASSGYMHKIGFSLPDGKELTNTESIEFWVYNASGENVEVDVYLSGTQDFVYDTLILQDKTWNKIVIDNFKFVSRDASVLSAYTEFGIRFDNSKYTLYVDDLFIR